MNKKLRTANRTKLKQAKAAFTRRKAERLITAATELSVLDDSRLQNPKLNKHAKHKLARKREKLAVATEGQAAEATQ